MREAPAVKEVGALLDAFHATLRCAAVVWVRAGGSAAGVLAAAPRPPGVVALDALPAVGPPAVVQVDGHDLIVVGVAGPLPAWVGVGPAEEGVTADLRQLAALLAAAVGQQLRSSIELELAANELAERYEEINLLYTTSEILGRTVSLPEAARTILTEISETVGARRAAILVHDRVTDTLQAVAALGASPEDVPPIATDDATSVSAQVFRTQRLMLVEPSEQPGEAERAYREGTMLSVPIFWTAPEGGMPLGVVNLSGRRPDQPFTAGDQKLVAAIATQIGTAIQNTRLVRASLSQQRLVQEMQLAHDLQMKLLPSCGVAAPDALVAARVVPAESVGGDFYHLFPLGGGRTGVMIGDVSGHGYRAALIMALVMSAAAIHAQTTHDPGAMLSALLRSVREELQTTEMFITVFYGVIDRDAGLLRYANAGHPHAFVLADDGVLDRLAALDPPLGMVDEEPTAGTRAWRSGSDTLLVFTDGVSDARDRHGRRLGEQAVLEAMCGHAGETPEDIVERVFALVNQHAAEAPRRDDLTLVVARS